MPTKRRPFALATLFWVLLVLFVLVDAAAGARFHNRFDEPWPWALGSGRNDGAKGAHCTAAPAS
jgi:hypothetical protein